MKMSDFRDQIKHSGNFFQRGGKQIKFSYLVPRHFEVKSLAPWHDKIYLLICFNMHMLRYLYIDKDDNIEEKPGK